MPHAPGQSTSWVSDRHLRVAFENDPGPALLDAASGRLRAANIHALQDITPAYATLLLHFNPQTLDADAVERTVRALLAAPLARSAPAAARRFEVPACYDQSCAPDLEPLAALHGLTIPDVIAMHAQAEYTVRFIGFAPGFPYLDGLPARLATPRLDTPRTRVPEGSIAVAGDQSGIYPRSTPGGWRLIARTPLRLFDPRATPPALFRTGDRIRFVPIDLARFNALLSSPAESP